MQKTIEFDTSLIRRYDQSGPRYTSYPTAVSFTDAFCESDYMDAAYRSNEDPIPASLSLYFHIPFCDTVCFYCGCNKIATKDYSRATSYLDLVYSEIALQAVLYDSDRVVEQLHWGGGTPTFLKHEDMQRLMEQTRSHFTLRDDDLGDYSIELDPRSVNAETIHFLRELGFNRFSLGVQDIDERVQKAVNRIQPIEQTQLVIDACRDAGARSINLDLIYGLPFQTVESFVHTLKTVIDMRPDRISVFNYAHLPQLFPPQRRISSDDLPPPEAKLAILKLVVETLTAAGYIYIGMDHFALPTDELVIAQRAGTLHRNFQGYSTHGNCDLVGLGVSAISNVGDVYSQNAKDIDTYGKAINNGKLPVSRGIIMSQDDMIRRDFIQHLTCDFAVNIHAFESRWNIDFEYYFSQEIDMLSAMESDGLVTVDKENILIPPKGRLLVRHLCMVFDVSIQKGREVKAFSKLL